MIKKKTRAKAELKQKPKVEENEETLLDIVEEDLLEEGIKLFENDNVENEYLKLPKDITEVDSKELGRYLNSFTQQKMWTRTLIGRMAINVRDKRYLLDEIKAEVFLDLPQRMSVKEKELQFNINKEARPILNELVIYEEKLRVLSDYLDNIVDAVFNISREISRRSSDWDAEKREESVSKKRR